MAFPDDILTDDEEVVLHLHPHWGSLVVPVLAGVVALAATVLGVFFIPTGFLQKPAQYLVLLLGIAAIGYFSVLPWLRWITTHYVVTTARLIIRDGITDRRRRDIPLVWLRNVSIDQSLAGRLLGSGTLLIDSAGDRGRILLADVPEVEHVHQTLYDLAQRIG